MPTSTRTLPDFQGYVSAQDPRTFPTVQPPVTTAAIRTLQAAPNTAPISAPSGDTVVPDQFSEMINMLKQYQQYGTTQQRSAQQEQYSRTTGSLPSDIAGAQLSPQQILNFRQGESAAVEPTIGGARSLINEAAKAIAEYQQSQDQARERVKDTLSLAAQGGSIALEGLLKTNPEIFKLAGIEPQSYIAGIRAREQTSKKSNTGVTVGGMSSNITQPANGFQFNSLNDIKKLPVSDLTKSIMAGFGKAKDLTPTDRAKVITELYQVGFNPNQYILKKLDSLRDLWEKTAPHAKGLVEGRIPFVTSASATAAEFESAKNILTREIARLNDVGMLSDQDVASYQAALPSRSDRNIDVVNAKLRGVGTALGAAPTTIRVKVKSSNQTGTIPENEFDPNVYERI